jgi:hypothetical protein
MTRSIPAETGTDEGVGTPEQYTPRGTHVRTDEPDACAWDLFDKGGRAFALEVRNALDVLLANVEPSDEPAAGLTRALAQQVMGRHPAKAVPVALELLRLTRHPAGFMCRVRYRADWWSPQTRTVVRYFARLADARRAARELRRNGYEVEVARATRSAWQLEGVVQPWS